MAAVLTIVFLLVFLTGVVDAVKPNPSQGVTRGGGVAAAIIGLVLAAVSILWAVHLEHGLRSLAVGPSTPPEDTVPYRPRALAAPRY